MIGVVDLHEAGGNLRSVAEAFRRTGNPLEVVSDASDLERAEALVLPGVGAFGDAMRSLQRQRLVDAIHRFAAAGQKPLLGICVGMQLLADESEEFGRHAGLGLVPGRVVRLAPASPGLRVPNMGWCDVHVARPSALIGPGLDGATFYFAHSYHLAPQSSADSVAVIDYDGPVTVAVQRGQVFGVQFHPEKSQDAGLQVIEHFCGLVGAQVR